MPRSVVYRISPLLYRQTDTVEYRIAISNDDFRWNMAKETRIHYDCDDNSRMPLKRHVRTSQKYRWTIPFEYAHYVRVKFKQDSLKIKFKIILQRKQWKCFIPVYLSNKLVFFFIFFIHWGALSGPLSVWLAKLVRVLAVPTQCSLTCAGGPGSIPGADKLDSWRPYLRVGKMRSYYM